MADHKKPQSDFSRGNALPLTALERIDAICLRIEEAWQKGVRPSLEKSLEGVPEPERTTLAGHLLRLDLHYRKKAGESPVLEDYLPRWPEYEQQLRRLFSNVETGTVDFVPRAADAERDTSSLEAGDNPTPTGGKPGSDAQFPSIPGYEIIKVLGRGGMGVVYLARQLQLNRQVALKMILAGVHAGEEEIARFLSEAEAVAALQHPNIVQVYEVGRHQGLPFMALEYVPGGTLAKKLKEKPPSPKESARLVEQLARGMNVAHQARIVHRDLKPGNVLLAADGTPKITDFGLAKKLEGGHQMTITGVIVGTPAYMAPEQAVGESKRVGPAADVYALGAILYECLTGRPPFQAANTFDLLTQVVSQEPVRPRQLQSKIPKDLETICLTCLNKPVAKHYASAADLAEDLDNWLTLKPIKVRPVSRAERLVKLLRRNPLRTALAAVGVVAVVLATGLLLAWEKGARVAREKADETLILNLLDQIGRTQGPPDLEEVAAFSILATLDKPYLRLRFVKVAVESEAKAEKIAGRAPMVAVALVGTNAKLKEQVLQLLSEKSDGEGSSQRLRDACGLLRKALEGKIKSSAEEMAGKIVKQMGSPDKSDACAEALAILANKMEPKQVAKILLHFQMNSGPLRYLTGVSMAKALRVVAGKMEPQQGTQLLLANIEWAVGMNADYSFQELTQAFREVAGKMEPQQAGQTAQDLIKRMDKLNGPFGGPFGPMSNPMPGLAKWLAIVAAKMEPQEAAEILLTQMKKDTFDPFLSSIGVPVNVLSNLAQGLGAVAGRMEPQQAAKVTDQAAQILLKKMDKNPNWHLDGVALNKMDKNPNSHLDIVATGLAAVAAKMEPKQGAQILLAQMDRIKTIAPGALVPLAQGLASVATNMEPQQGTQLLLNQMVKYPDPGVQAALALGLAATAVKLPPQHAGKPMAEAAQVLLKQMIKSDSQVSENMPVFDFLALEGLAHGLAALAAKSEPQQAKKILGQAAHFLLKRMSKVGQIGLLPLEHGMNTDGSSGFVALEILARALDKVASRMEPDEAAKVAGEAAEILLARVAKSAPAVYNKSLPAFRKKILAQQLSVITGRMGPKQASSVAKDAAQLFLTEIETSPSLSAKYLIDGLVSISKHLEPDQAEKYSQESLAKMVKTTEPERLVFFELGLQSLVLRMHKAGLVNALKNPLCVGNAQDIVLQELGTRFGKQFDGLWDFVESAEQREPMLDLRSPWQRPKDLGEP